MSYAVPTRFLLSLFAKPPLAPAALPAASSPATTVDGAALKWKIRREVTDWLSSPCESLKNTSQNLKRTGVSKHPLRVPGMWPGESFFICKSADYTAKNYLEESHWEKYKIWSPNMLV